jgi:hypothetical protein
MKIPRLLRRHLIPIAWILSSIVGLSSPQTERQAAQAVSGWLSVSPRPLGTPLSPTLRKPAAFRGDFGVILYYVVPLDPEGFVVVSGDSDVEPIIAFSASGRFEAVVQNPLFALLQTDMPNRLRSAHASANSTAKALDQARTKWTRLDRAGQGRTPKPRDQGNGMDTVDDLRVPPFIQSRWNQSTIWNGSADVACYNYYTPPYAAGTSSNYVCGCNNTAWAQIMRYFQYPTQPVGTASFTIEVDGVSTTRQLRGGDGNGGPYNWDQMPLIPGVGTTDSGLQAIGALTADIGTTAGTSYAVGGSGSYLDIGKLKTVFHFGNAVDARGMGDQFLTPVNPNLDARLPVYLIVAINNNLNSLSHAVVCDGYGYNAGGLYHHLNIGWGGSEDAWYNLPNVDTGWYAFTALIDCIYNIFTNGTGEIISGRVVDTNNAPLAGATITATCSPGGTYAAASDANGIFALTQVPSCASFRLAATKPGYAAATQGCSTGQDRGTSGTGSNVWGADFMLVSSNTPPIIAVSPADGLTFSGNVGGPFSPANGSYTVNNAGGGTLNWTAVADQSWVTVAPTSGQNWGAVSVSINPTANLLSSGTHSATLTFAGNGSAASRQVQLTVYPPGIGLAFQSIDIGTDIGWMLPGLGSTTPIGTNGYDVVAAGFDIWGSGDGFRFVYTSITGDFDVMVRVASLTMADAWTKGGLIAREGTSSGARYFDVFATPADGVNLCSCECRTDSYANAVSLGNSGAPFAGTSYPNTWLRLQRTGSVFQGYRSADGVSWTSLASKNISMASSLCVGLATTAHGYAGAGLVTTAQYRDITVAWTPSVALQTSPSGLSLILDGTAYTAPRTFSWPSGSTHQIATTSPQSGGQGTQYVWSGWSDGGAMSHTVSATSNAVITAAFTPQYYLTVNAGTGGAVNPGSGWYNGGTGVSIAATPSAGHTFCGWAGSGAGSYSGSASQASVTMKGPITETAEFVAFYTITAAPSSAAGGSTTGAGTYTNGCTVTLTASASPQYQFVAWTENGVQVSPSATYAFSACANRVLVANFVALYTITAAPSLVPGGSTMGAGTYTNGSTVTLTAIANPQYQFVNWTENGLQVSASSNYAFAACSSRLLIANFVALYTVTAAPSLVVGGSVRGAGTFTNGSLVALSACANMDFHFVGWTEAGAVVCSSNIYSFTLTENRNLMANFMTNPTCAITLTASPSGAGMTSGGGAFKTGSTRTVRATAAKGFIFDNWTENGAVASSSAGYTFVLNRSRSLVANFIPNPFPSVSGTYTGLFLDETNGVSPRSAGCITVSPTAGGAFSGTLQVAGSRSTLSGQFDNSGRASVTVPRQNANPLLVELQLYLSPGADHITGHVSDGTWTAEIVANRAFFDGKTVVAPQFGTYTLIFSWDPASAAVAAGFSYGTLSVSKAGAVSCQLFLADGTKITPSSSLSKDGQWPLYSSLNAGQGVVAGWVDFTNVPAGDLAGALVWIKPDNASSQLYPNGFSLASSVSGSHYTQPGKGANVLSLTDANVLLEGGNLAGNITCHISLSPNNRVTDLSGNNLGLTFTLATGIFTGHLTDPATRKQISFSGVVLQKQNAGYGYFLGINQSGQVLLSKP